MKIVIEFPDSDRIAEELADVTDHQIRYILMDALAEFVSHRGPTPAAYVERRYADNPDLNTIAKVAEVRNRCRIAEVLRFGDPTIER
jgi:hypothetical protein